MDTQVEPLLVDKREAKRLLSISERTLWDLTNSGKIPAVRIGKLWRYSPTDLRAWVKAKGAAAE